MQILNEYQIFFPFFSWYFICDAPSPTKIHPFSHAITVGTISDLYKVPSGSICGNRKDFVWILWSYSS